MKEVKQEFLQIGKSDLVKGAIMAALTALALAGKTLLSGFLATPIIYPTSTDAIHIGSIGAVAFVSYLVKNFFTNSNDEFMKKEPAKSAN